MFTGIVSELAVVISVEQKIDHLHLVIQSRLTSGLVVGASIAIDGVCLTVTSFQGDRVEFDVITETLHKTNLGELSSGSTVHLERSLRFGDEVGGHLVSGHVHGVGRVMAVERSPFKLWIQVSSDLSGYIFQKGFISLAGVSLTVVDRLDDRFSVALIPETLRSTKFADAQIGHTLNIELDQQTKTIVETVARVLGKDSKI